MQSSIWLASIFGPFLLILGIWGLFYRENMIKVFSSIKANPGILYVLAVFNLWMGLVVLNCYNTWTQDAMALVTLLGWALVLHGICALFLPQLVLKTRARGKGVSFRAVIFFIWGLSLCWLAFWAH